VPITTEEAHAKTGLSLRYLQQLLKDKRVDGFKASSVLVPLPPEGYLYGLFTIRLIQRINLILA
jgi:hypothetical protein